MENILQSIEWLTIFLTFLGGIYMYVNHTRKLNKQQEKINEQDERLNEQQHQLNEQQKQINEYQLQKNNEEALEKKQAIIEANVYKAGKSNWKMKIYNRGKAKATNIDFESESLDNDDRINLIGDPNMFPLPSLLPQGSIELEVMLCIGHQSIHRMKFTWNDESGTERSQEQDVVFN